MRKSGGLTIRLFKSEKNAFVNASPDSIDLMKLVSDEPFELADSIGEVVEKMR